MAVIRGARTAFHSPWLITLAENAKPLDFAHEIAHAMLYLKGFSRTWAQAIGMTQKQYEAIVWSVCAKFVKDEYWDLPYIIEILDAQ